MNCVYSSFYVKNNASMIMSGNIADIQLDIEKRIVDNFKKQSAMALIKANVHKVDKGYVEVHMPYWDGVLQQHNFIHGGVLGMLADTCAGYSAMTLVPVNKEVLTVEYKINMVAPAKGEKIIAKGSVIRAGRTLITTKAELYSYEDGKETLVAVMQQTMMALEMR